MTELSDTSPIYQLPEQPTLDALSAAALAVMEALDAQLATSPDAVSVVLDPKALAAAALSAVEGDRFPRIPAWSVPRSIGGGSPLPGLLATQPAVRVDVAPGGNVQLTVEATCDHDGDVEEVALVPAADARTFFLAGLAACEAAERGNDPQRNESPVRG